MKKVVTAMGNAAVPGSQGDDLDESPSVLRILATSDLHVQIFPWDYHSDQPSPARGLSRTAGLIAQARAEVACSILLDNGDFLQGSPMGDVVALGAMGDILHPMIAAMNQLRYDAGTLGNHEFSHGLAFLERSLRDLAFPIVSANIARSHAASPLDDDHLVLPHTILTRRLTDASGAQHDLRIGIIGFAPPQTAQWDNQQIQGAVLTRDILEAARAHIPALRGAGADIVIALSHSGIGRHEASPEMENATTALAALPGIDALIAGHTHLRFPSDDFPSSDHIDPVAGDLFGKPAVMPGFYGSHLGVIDLSLIRTTAGWRVAGHHTELRPIAFRDGSGTLQALTGSDTGVEAVATPAHLATRTWAGRAVGVNDTPLHSFFSLVSACPSVRLVAQAQADHVARALKSTPWASLPVISAAAPFRAGGRGGPENYSFVPKGPLELRHVADLYFHPNTIAALVLTGGELADWLERSVGIFQQIHPGSQDAELIDPDFPSFNFDMLEGLTYQIDLSQPARFDSRGGMLNPDAHRITDLSHGGAALQPAARFVLATNSYRTNSGGFAGALPDRVVLSGPQSNREILLQHLTELGHVPDPGAANWGFKPMPGTTVVFDSAPAARDFLPDLRFEPLEVAPTGFRRFRLHL